MRAACRILEPAASAAHHNNAWTAKDWNFARHQACPDQPLAPQRAVRPVLCPGWVALAVPVLFGHAQGPLQRPLGPQLTGPARASLDVILAVSPGLAGVAVITSERRGQRLLEP